MYYYNSKVKHYKQEGSSYHTVLTNGETEWIAELTQKELKIHLFMQKLVDHYKITKKDFEELDDIFSLIREEGYSDGYDAGNDETEI